MGHANHDTALLDRAAGVVLGGAIGDALGAGYEFAAAPRPEDVTMLPGTLTGAPAGYWTDDTAMAIAVLEAAAKRGTLITAESLAAVGDGFLRWYNSGPSDIGIHTSAVLSRAASGSALHLAARVVQSADPTSASNGSLMRTGPVALAHLGDPTRLKSAAIAVSALTHAHQEAIEACVLWTAAIDHAVRTGKLSGPRVGLCLIDEPRRAHWEQKITDAERKDPLTFSSNGYVVTALQAAWSAIYATQGSSEHFKDGLCQAVAIGNDTDTVAAIAGYLLGGCYGESAMPSGWITGLAGWPETYDAKELTRLARLAVLKDERS